jgi:hypothetical protein
MKLIDPLNDLSSEEFDGALDRRLWTTHCLGGRASVSGLPYQST